MRPTRRPFRATSRLRRGRATLLAALPLIHAGSPRHQNPSALLGEGHPLVRASDALAVLSRQTLAVTAALAACSLAAVAGATWARAAALAAATVLVVLAALAAALLGEVRQRAMDLILEGRERLPLAAVKRERRRLLSPRTRVRLATGLAGVLEEALMPRGVPVASASLLADARVLRVNAGELRAVAALMRAAPASARGVALVECLLTDGCSPLYGKEVEPLREELRRASYLLQSRAGATER